MPTTKTTAAKRVAAATTKAAKTPVCHSPGCRELPHAKGLCPVHYREARKALAQPTTTKTSTRTTKATKATTRKAAK